MRKTKTKSGGLWKTFAVLAVFGLALVLTGCPDPAASPDNFAPVASVTVVPDPANPGVVLDETRGTLNYLITIVGDIAFPLDLRGAGVGIAQSCGAPLPGNISVNPLAAVVGSSGVPYPLGFVVDGLAPGSFSVVVSVGGTASAPFNLVVGTIASVQVVPAPNPGVALPSLWGNLDYLIRIDGMGIEYAFPINFDEITVTLAGEATLPPNITLRPGTVDAAGSYFPFGFSVFRPVAAVYSLVVNVRGAYSDPFDLVITSDDSIAGQIARLHIMGLGGEQNFVMETGASSETIRPQELYFGGQPPVTITIRGDPGDTLYLDGQGAMFTVGAGVTLVLDNVTLHGIADNDRALVVVDNGGTLIMNAGSTITGNTNTNADYYGGGVQNMGSFRMNAGAAVSGNRAFGGGGGVANEDGGSFHMLGGTISGNVGNGGGGVRTEGLGWFAMRGGEIYGNASIGSPGWGGGVMNFEGYFLISDGLIHGVDALPGYENTAVAANAAALSSVSLIGGARTAVSQRGTFNLEGTSFSGGGSLSGTDVTIEVEGGDGAMIIGVFGHNQYAGNALRLSAYVGGVWRPVTSWWVVPATDMSNLHFPSTPGDWTLSLEFAATVGTTVLMPPFAAYTISRNFPRGLTNISLAEFTPPSPGVPVTVTGIPARYNGFIGSFWVYRTGWENFAPWAQVTGGSLSFDFHEGSWSFEVDFFEMMGPDNDIPVLRATYSVLATISETDDTISFGDFVPARGHGLRPQSAMGSVGLMLPIETLELDLLVPSRR